MYKKQFWMYSSILTALCLGLVLVGCNDLPTQSADPLSSVSSAESPRSTDATPSKTNGSVKASAKGSGHFRQAGSKRTFTFSGHLSEGNDVDGQFKLQVGGNSFSGKVTCMTVHGNEVWMGAIGREGAGWGWRVADNGEGGESQDMISYAYRAYPEFAEQFCQGMFSWAFLVPIDAGNVEVHSTGPKPQLVYAEDFESPLGSEWSLIQSSAAAAGPTFLGNFNDPRSTSPSGATFFGNFSDDAYHEAVLTLADLPRHSELRITFDLYVLQTMDGNNDTYGLDLFTFAEQSTGYSFQTTFSGYGGPQAFPAAYGDGEYGGYTGASAVNSLGYPDADNAMDVIYPVTLVIPHTGASTTVSFGAENLQDYLDANEEFFADESWGLDNVKVEIIR